MPQSAKFLAGFASLFIFFEYISSAQTALSTVRGTVTDRSGAVVIGADLSIIDVRTNVRRSTVSREAGNFEIPDLKPGIYRLRVEMRGFKTFVADSIQLESAQIRRVDVELEVGDATTVVTVAAAPALINTEEAKVASALSNRTYENAPLSARNRWNPNMMLTTLPQVQPNNSGNGFEISGVASGQIEEGMDGAPTQGIVNQIHNVEDVEEIKIVTNNNSAEYPRAGYFNLVGKRGYNDFHGNAFYYLQTSALNARQFFDPRKVPLLYHSYGTSAGGRILRDRTFFYASYNGMLDKSHNTVLTTTPTVKMRQGDFSDLLNQARPTTVRDPLSGMPFAGNVIPSSRLNPLPLSVQNKYITPPNIGAPGQLTQNLTIVFPYPVDLYRVDYLTGRIDHEFSAINRLIGAKEDGPVERRYSFPVGILLWS